MTWQLWCYAIAAVFAVSLVFSLALCRIADRADREEGSK